MKVTDILLETPIDMTGDPNDPTIYGHAKANPMSLKGRIQQARNQLQELAQLAESDDLVVWEKITRLSKGGMFMGLEQNLEQIRHGIAELAAKRKQGGVASRGIDKNIGEQHINEYGDTAKGQKMLTKVQKRAVDRVVSKKADTDPKYAKKNADTADRAWERMSDKDLEEGLKNPKDNPCWKGYKPVGTKKKGGRTVPNCVPKE